MPNQLARKVLGRAKTFSNKFHAKQKHNSGRNTICVQYPETIKTAIYNEWNKGLMKRLRQSVADPLWPAHEKRSGRQNAYKASSLPLWSNAENSPSGASVTFFALTNPQILTLQPSGSASLLLHNAVDCNKARRFIQLCAFRITSVLFVWTATQNSAGINESASAMLVLTHHVHKDTMLVTGCDVNVS